VERATSQKLARQFCCYRARLGSGAGLERTGDLADAMQQYFVSVV